jgi:hypothetical protein
VYPHRASRRRITAWSDDLATPGASRYANGIRPPLVTFERYGAIALVEAVSPKPVEVDDNPVFMEPAARSDHLLSMRRERANGRRALQTW